MQKKDFLAGAAIGAIVGSIVGILLAPKSGKETINDAKKAAENLSKKITAEISRLQTVSKKQYDEIVEKALKNLKKHSKITKEKIEEIQKDLKSKWSSLNKQFKK